MPNWVVNKVTFIGNQDKIEKILEQIKGKDALIDFNKIIRMPDYIYNGDLGTKERKKYGENNWYDWRIRNWGGKMERNKHIQRK